MIRARLPLLSESMRASETTKQICKAMLSSRLVPDRDAFACSNMGITKCINIYECVLRTKANNVWEEITRYQFAKTMRASYASQRR